MNAPQDFRTMTSESIGKSILQALVTEIKLLQDPWPKLSKEKQDFVIDRLRECVAANVGMAVHLLASEGRTVVTGDLEQINIKEGVKAVLTMGNTEASHELADQAGGTVLVVIEDADRYTSGEDGLPSADDDQRPLL